LLQARREKRVDLYTSTPLLAELTDILARPKFGKKIAASLLTLDQLVDRYAALAKVVRTVPIAPTAPDPDDDVVIATALAASADFLVTGDRALRAVGQYQDIRIVTVAETLKVLVARQ